MASERACTARRGRARRCSIFFAFAPSGSRQGTRWRSWRSRSLSHASPYGGWRKDGRKSGRRRHGASRRHSARQWMRFRPPRPPPWRCVRRWRRSWRPGTVKGRRDGGRKTRAGRPRMTAAGCYRVSGRDSSTPASSRRATSKREAASRRLPRNTRQTVPYGAVRNFRSSESGSGPITTASQLFETTSDSST